MKALEAAAIALVAAHSVSANPTRHTAWLKRESACDCASAAFKPLSAQEWVKAANPGWNIGNTLDALPDEGSWNNPRFQESTLDYVKAAGFKSVRIPVTYAEHYVSSSPDWSIDPKWLQRVEDVVDMATSRGLYVITNMHHDSWSWADVSQPSANLTMIQEKFHASWLQIANKLCCKSEVVAFEPINEPPGNNAEDGAKLMKLNDLFLQALTETGGFNTKRVITLSGPGMGADKMHWFKAPTNITNPWAFQFHFYNPYDFVFNAWGKTIWGSDADKAGVTAELSSVRGNFTDVPIVLGEFDASQVHLEPAARWKWFDHVVRTAKSLDILPVLWDNGLDNLDRATGKWRDQTAIDIIMHATAGEANSLPDSTTDPAAMTQASSAYIFNKAGTTPTDHTLPFLLNGNTFGPLSIGSTRLVEGRDYTPSDADADASLTFHASFLAQYLSATASPGTKANITVTFSSGAPTRIELVQWDVPRFSALSSPARDAPADGDLNIPVEWRGLHRAATVEITKADGGFLVDDWTQWLGGLQKGRGTYLSQWNFDHDRVMITRAAVDAVIASGQNTTFRWEFYPRAEGNGNWVEYTLTV
ncbi:hypothetical protein MFIFM68171_04825 [Madurella fahalii]|uniref:Cellulase n=1 Tax=Madurella fahalii TaxID=1157608 RepID=A0ABQ0GA21_9PEZI